MKNNANLACRTLLALSLTLFTGGFVWAQQTQETEKGTVVESRSVSGEVSAINARGIAIVYDRNYDTGAEYEIFLPLEKNTVLKHKGSFKEIKAGDLVSADYVKTKEGKSILKSVTFIQSGVADVLESTPEPAPAEVSEEVQGDAEL